MPRAARIVVPGFPHHVTQRGNRRERIFFSPHDYDYYRGLIAVAARHAGTDVWAYCFMPNHIHAIMVPSAEAGLSRTFAGPSRRYAIAVNTRFGWSGHLWQGRFGSVAMDETHLVHAVRYVSLNPVRAGLVSRAEEWPWSSAGAHLAGADDELVRVGPILARFQDFRSLIEDARPDREFALLRHAERSGSPVGAKEFVKRLTGKGDS